MFGNVNAVLGWFSRELAESRADDRARESGRSELLQDTRRMMRLEAARERRRAAQFGALSSVVSGASSAVGAAGQVAGEVRPDSMAGGILDKLEKDLGWTSRAVGGPASDRTETAAAHDVAATTSAASAQRVERSGAVTEQEEALVDKLVSAARRA